MIRVAAQRPVTLDPIAMQDLSAYGLVAQSFEFLCTLSADASDIAPGLAESWTPNSDNTVWTFKLRQGVTWQDGTPFSSADVVATMERLVAAGTAGIKGGRCRLRGDVAAHLGLVSGVRSGGVDDREALT